MFYLYFYVFPFNSFHCFSWLFNFFYLYSVTLFQICFCMVCLFILYLLRNASDLVIIIFSTLATFGEGVVWLVSVNSIIRTLWVDFWHWFAFTALTLLVGRQKEHLACKNWVMRCRHGYLSWARWKWFAYGPADASATPSSVALLKPRLV